MSSAGARKDMQTILAILRKKGYKHIPSGRQHVQILDKHGTKIIDEHGPLIVSSTPSDFRARDLAWNRIENAGLVTPSDNPWKPQKGKSHGLMLADDDGDGGGERLTHKERERQATRLQQVSESRSRHERTQLIRGRLEPILTALGGWTKRGMQSEIADVLYYFTKDTPIGFPSKGAALQNVVSLRKGGTLADKTASAWEALLDDFEQAPDISRRWFDLVRESRGLPPRKVPVGLVPVGNGDAPAATRERYSDAEHPLLELHRDGGLRWPVEFTIDDLNELSRAVGFFEGLAVQLAVFDGQELVEPALEKIRQIVNKVGESRHNQLVKRAEEGGSWR